MMALFEQIAFLNPLALAALALLPVIWWLLRFTPPVPQSVKFPPLRILLGLENKEQESDKTPWWLLLLRLAIAALLILGVSYPDYAPGRSAAVGSTPLLLVVDDSWPASRQWNERREVMKELLQAAQRQGAPVTLAVTAPEARAPELAPKTAADSLTRAAALEPRALPPARLALLAKLNETFATPQALRVIWIPMASTMAMPRPSQADSRTRRRPRRGRNHRPGLCIASACHRQAGDRRRCDCNIGASRSTRTRHAPFFRCPRL
ncbi:MAG: hypothetical protein HC855_08500 [Rhizobiales bacterium]|nr:hypothetical protein [Hyphomicrobiales bacterium]